MRIGPQCDAIRDPDLLGQRLDQELKELKRLRDDMKTTVQVWRQMPDGAPNGHSVQEFSRAPTSVYAYIFGLKISERPFILGRPI